MTRRRGRTTSFGVLAFATAGLASAVVLSLGCTDGVTPDCSDAAVCAPSEGSVPPLDASGDARDGSADTGTPADAGGDARSDAASDGG